MGIYSQLFPNPYLSVEAKTYGLGESMVNGRDHYFLLLHISTIFSLIKLVSADISAKEPLFEC